MAIKLISKQTVPAAIMAALVLAALFIYEAYSFAGDMALAAALFVLYYMNRHEKENNGNQAYVVMLLVATIFMIARFYRIFSYPADFNGDEWSRLIEAYFRVKNNSNIFDYNVRFGVSLPYICLGVEMVIIKLFSRHIELIRLVAPLLAYVSAAAFYITGRELKGKKFGIILVFIYALSGWGFYLSRIPMENVYVPAFAAVFIALFLVHIRTGKLGYLISAGIIFFFGFYTYSSWLLLLPFSLLLCFEYRHELGNKKAWVSAATCMLSAVFFAILCLKNSATISWGGNVAGFGTHGSGIFNRIANLFNFFGKPLGTTESFFAGAPILNATEFIVLFAGIALAAARISKRECRIFLIGFIISLATLVISNKLDHHLRHVLILPFAVVLAAFFLYEIIKAGYSAPLLAAYVILSTLASFTYFTVWGLQFNAPGLYREIASYINSQEEKSVFIDGTLPYGTPAVSLRTESLSGEKHPDKIYFLTTIFWRKDTLKVFPAARKKYFYYSNFSKQPSLALWELDVKNNEGLLEYFEKLDNKLSKINLDMWRLDYSKAAIDAGKNIVPFKKDGLAVFKNSVMRYLQFEAYRMAGNKDGIAALFEDNHAVIFETADNLFFLGVAYLEKGDFKKGITLIRKAEAIEPEWKEPSALLKLLVK